MPGMVKPTTDEGKAAKLRHLLAIGRHDLGYLKNSFGMTDDLAIELLKMLDKCPDLTLAYLHDLLCDRY